MTIKFNSKREKLAISFANWIFRHFTSKQYLKYLNTIIGLGLQEAEIMLAKHKLLEKKLASAPGMDPVSGETINTDESED